MERLLEELIKAPKQNAKKSREQNLKRKVHVVRINNEENAEDEDKREEEENGQVKRENMLHIKLNCYQGLVTKLCVTH